MMAHKGGLAQYGLNALARGQFLDRPVQVLRASAAQDRGEVVAALTVAMCSPINAYKGTPRRLLSSGRLISHGIPTATASQNPVENAFRAPALASTALRRHLHFAYFCGQGNALWNAPSAERGPNLLGGRRLRLHVRQASVVNLLALVSRHRPCFTLARAKHRRPPCFLAKSRSPSYFCQTLMRECVRGAIASP